MRKTLGILLVLFICFAGSLHLTAASDDKMDILKKSDNAVSSFLPAKFMQRMEDYENQQFKRYSLFEVYVKGDERYLIVGLEPALMKGIAQMRVGGEIFTYLKKIDLLEQVSAKTNFGNSTLSAEDIIGGRLENFYNVDNMTTTKEKDKDFVVLTVVAKSKDVAYKKIENYLDPVTYAPVKRLYYAFSGKQVKEMTFDEIGFKDGKQSSLKITMYDSLRKGWFTKMSQYDFDYSQEVPDKIYTRMYLRTVAK
jgi:hypothetical protein